MMSANDVLRTAFWNYDRTMPLVDGRVPIDGARLSIEILSPEETFARAYQGDGFDVCEVSFSNSVTAASKGTLPYVLIPAFLSRAFRHSSIFIRTDRGINGPADLRGKTIGMQEYDMTAAVVVRGILRDTYDVQAADIRWRIGDAVRLKPLQVPRNERTANLTVSFQPEGVTLEESLLAGELDAIVSLRVPKAFVAGSPMIARLFPDSHGAEKAWFAKTGIFPIMHAVGIKRAIADARPGLTKALYDAFSAAKALAIADLSIIQAPKVTLPWPHQALNEAKDVMGPDFWPYGIEANRHVLETQLRWSFEDGLQDRRVNLSDLFAADCMRG
jgi:4,5-dihydroxyphthalate decarboxylase